MKATFLTLVVLLGLIGLQAQKSPVPTNASFEDKEAYAKYQEDFLACLDWMVKTPMNQYPRQRAKTSAWMLEWMIGTPTVSLELKGDVVNIGKKNSEFLLIYMAGSAQYMIENNSKDQAAASLAGVNTVIEMYLANKPEIGKDKMVEKLIKLKEREKLEAYLAGDK